MRRVVVGAIAWVSIAQFFVVEELVRRGWTLPYSRSTNFISDLGAVTCGTYGARPVCSPGHIAMNLSFVLVGVAVGLGALLLRTALPRLLTAPVLVMFAAAAVGSLLVGAFPEDTVGSAHVAGAGAFFVGANLGQVLLGWRLRLVHRVRGLALAAVGAVGLLGTALILAEASLGLGIGFVERVVVYGADLGFVATGALLLTTRRALRPGGTSAPRTGATAGGAGERRA